MQVKGKRDILMISETKTNRRIFEKKIVSNFKTL